MKSITKCRKIKLLSDLLIDRRIRLAGHILRSNDNDPLRRVSYEPNSAVTFDVGKRRVGGPRQQWTQYSNKYAWENALGKGRYENTAQQNQELLKVKVKKKTAFASVLWSGAEP